MPTFLYAYNQGSNSAKEVAEGLGIRRISHQRSRFRGGPNKKVINWGSSNLPDNISGSVILNDPRNIATASNKLLFFRKMAESNNPPRIPEWTDRSDVALEWLSAGDNTKVCIRSVLQGHSARGLTIISRDNLGEFVDAPLYTKYVAKRDEYRVHIVSGEVIDVQRKALRNDVDREEANWQVRNLANGFIFARNDAREVPQDVIDQSLLSLSASGLDFGAVDVVFNERLQQAFVLEINTAPGVMGTTLSNYVEAFRRII